MDTLVNTPKQVVFTLCHKSIGPAAFSATVAVSTKGSQDQAPGRTWPVAPVKGANRSSQHWGSAQMASGEWVSSQAVGKAAVCHLAKPSLGCWTRMCRLLPVPLTAVSPQHHYI